MIWVRGFFCPFEKEEVPKSFKQHKKISERGGKAAATGKSSRLRFP